MKLNILLICNKPIESQDANTIIDHISAFQTYSNHMIFVYSNLGGFPKNLDLKKFDVVIIHYSITLINDVYLSVKAKKQLKNFKGLKILFIQDEYRQINKIISEIILLEIDVLFSCFPESEMEKIYKTADLPKVSKYSNLTGYIPNRILKIANLPKISTRTIDVGYRSRKVPFWLGQLGFEKWDIVERWSKEILSSNQDIQCDISYNEEDRKYGKEWIAFLTNCKTTLGVESGASVMDFSGNIQKCVEDHQKKHPNDSFQTIHDLYLKPHEAKYKLNQISPRCFEAIALKTVLILYEGEYSGILTPWKHYIPLKKDFSNLSTILPLIKDHYYLQNMADTAYQDIALNPIYSYKQFIARVDNILSKEFIMRKIPKTTVSYSFQEFLELIKPPQLFYTNTIFFNNKLAKQAIKLIRPLILKCIKNPFLIKLKPFVTRKIKIFNPVLNDLKSHIQK